MYYVAEAIYREALPCTRAMLNDTLLPAHAAHIRAGAETGLVLLAGPKGEGDGGFLILSADDRGALDRFLDADPLVVHGVQTFRVTPWQIFDVSPAWGTP
jgi:uncharacterized protein YciI